MQRIIISVSILFFSLTAISGCTFFPEVHKIDIQQGNRISQAMVDKLKPGMNRNQVRYLMGSPLLTDTFSQDRWDYLYSLKPGKQAQVQQRLTLFFENDQLTHFSGDLRPATESAAAQQ